MLPLFASGRTHRGGRPENQDAFGITQDHDALATFLADGVGGEAGGRLAGRLGARTATKTFCELGGLPPVDRLRAAMLAGHTAVCDGHHANPRYRDMASTLVGVASDGDRLWLSWVGDSPAFLVRGRVAKRLTRPHVQLDGGYPSLTRYLGASRFDPEEVSLDLEPGDRIILCSDGASDVIAGRELASLVSRQSADEAARLIVRTALHRDTGDNATAVVVVRAGVPADPSTGLVRQLLAAVSERVCAFDVFRSPFQ